MSEGGVWGAVRDVELLDVLRDRHRSAAIAQCGEVDAVTELYRRRVVWDRNRGVNARDAGETAGVEAAAALRVTEGVANSFIDVGLALQGLPLTRAAFAVGDIDLARVRVLVELTMNLSAELIARLEGRLVDAARSSNPGRLRVNGRRWIAAADPSGEKGRRERRVEDRDVRVRATTDGMAFPDGLLPVGGAQTVAARLVELAQEVCGKDPRSFAQRRADALVVLADGSGRLVCGCGQGVSCPVAGVEPGPARKPLIQVGVSVETLLGLREWPGYVAGLGVVDADLARMLAVDGRWEWVMAAIDAAVEQERTAGDRADSVRPATACEDATPAAPADPVPQPARPRTAAGRAVAAVGSCAGSGVWDDPESPGALRYEWSAGLARWIRARDGTCRFPGCVVAAARCDIDHCERYNHRRPRAGGRTIRSNGACLCRRHHRLKTAGENGGNGWRVRQLGDGRLEWTTPTGELIATEPTGAGFLWPTTEIGEVCPKPVEVPAAVGGWVVCSDPTLLQEMNRTGITVEEQLRFMLEVAGVQVRRTRVQPQPPTPAEDPPDPDEPPPF
ncbi:HNH endonuclease signature motif containing protein [Antrihabitans sp. YC2-6]|uniref:HNH endonuclease signature motif containing protein n=1 Tax=Antrihabitans sp. YC2-6 TaxID=2799498 RepID=UPI0018F2BB05|nr:HNH endonuclease signature motif containing protein [Antrihabitans sp. YC2-6]MBJ8345876.1 DUF222 domain-containing protein [Antrihabitans sp. YC2-6]